MASTQVVLLTLLPSAPRDPGLFQADLKDLKIDAFDLTVKDNQDGDPVGTCAGVLGAQGELITGPIDITPRQTNPPAPPKLKTAILPHFKLQLQAPVVVPLSVATAVIVLNIPAGHSEFDTLDLRLVITRNGNAIGKSPPLEFNVPMRSIPEPLSTEPSIWIGYENNSPTDTDPVYRAGYVFVPPVPKIVSSRPNLKLGQDGVTPNFDSLVDLVNEVLADDHTSTDPDPNTSLQTRKTPLDVPQCLQIARELIYDRAVYPLPEPKNKSLEDMYSNPNVASSDDQDRKQFEADVSAYYAQHDAEATQLSNFVFAAASAIDCEKSSIAQSSASVSFQIVSQANQQPPYASKTVIVKGVTSGTNTNGYLSPTFGIPAAFFYALGFSLPSQLNTQDRLTSAYIASEAANLKKLQAAVDGGIIDKTETAKTSTDALLKDLNIQQAARRIDALGPAAASLTTINLNNDISALITDWLNYAGDSSNISAFWKTESTSQAVEYLHLVLSCIIAEKTDLEKEIKTALNISTVIQLAAVKDDAWRNFWIPTPTSATDTTPAYRASLLPNYTIPGSTAQRTEAFIRFIKTLFSVGEVTHSADPPDAGDIQVLGRPAQDILQLFFNALPTFTFTAAIDDNAITTALESLQVDNKLRAWAKQAIKTVGFLFTVTTFQNADKQNPAQQFALIESLYARGFVTPNRIAVLTKSQFHTALSGTVAYYTTSSGVLISDLIYAIADPLATNVPSLGPEADDGFSPINPGNLVNCIPPKYMSPFSVNMYLKALLLLMVTTKSVDQSIATILQTRRGALGSLQVSVGNSDVNVPLIDLANESLEALVEQVAAGTITGATIYNTTASDFTELGFTSSDISINPDQLLSAVPQHSSPYLPNPPAKAYDILKLDFSSPFLPYDQELDLNRTYMKFLRTSRFDVMRTFRSDITAFALDVSKEPADFRKTLWRYPVRPDIALEYLTISVIENQYLYTRRLDSSNIPGLYGYSSGDEGWLADLSSLDTFLQRTGSSYCEFYELWQTGFVSIQRYVPNLESAAEHAVAATSFPSCEPCCLSSYRLSFAQGDQVVVSLWKIAVFIRLWRKVESHYGVGKVSLKAFAAICQVLGLFVNDDLNPDFIYQLSSFFMLCDRFCLPICIVDRKPSSSETASQVLSYYVPVLGIWTDSLPDEGSPQEAIRLFLKGVECFAMSKYNCPSRGAQFRKVLAENLSDLSILFGFTHDIAWNAKPACTLRFAEILGKIYASPFTVGELIFLFTTNNQLEGDDPFPWTEPDESRVDPLNVPEDDRKYGLWSLRRKLLRVHPEHEDVQCWSWDRIVRTLRDDFDFKNHDALTKLAEHFFPSALNHSVPSQNRRFSTPLKPEDTSPQMWDAPPCQPFHYDDSSSQLWAEIPLQDEEVLKKLAHIRQLRDYVQGEGESEFKAIKELYFQPRAMLSPFSVIFGDLSEAIDILVQEPCEEDRFKYFQRCFARFYKRCEILAEHLAAHVNTYADSQCCGNEKEFECKRSRKLAWDIIKRLIADENLPGTTPWENDSGTSPPLNTFTWEARLSGGAFAALLGLTGTGLLGQFQVGSANSTWQEIRGPMSAFGCVLDRENVPVPMIIPNLLVKPTATESDVVHFRNGFVFDDVTAENLGGAQSFKAKWEGILLIEEDGCYRFCADRPRFDRNRKDHEHHRECDDHCDDAKWSVKLRRGQKHWTILRHGETGDGHVHERQRDSVTLLHGAYEVMIEFEQPKPEWKEDERPDHIHTGFGVKYSGPDTDDCEVFIPMRNLYLKSKDGPLDVPREEQGGSAQDFLQKRYISTLRDIRRTYQRAFKAFLFAYRFCLSAEPCGCCRSTSELDYMLDNAANFSGAAYYPGPSRPNTLTTTTTPSGQYLTHLANFDFNFLPVNDAYYPPDRNRDNRAGPSPQRSSAMFDWWERTYDYRCLSQEVERLKTCYGPLWRLFFEASTQVATDTSSLVRYLGVDLGLSSLTLTYFENKVVQSADLQDERWPIRIHHAWEAINTIRQVLSNKATHAAHPELWASTSPSTTLNHGDPAPQRTGNQNLIYVVNKTLLADQDTPQFEELKRLNDCLRLRAYNALVAYLCGVDRVQLGFLTTNSEQQVPTAQNASDLSALLLQDLDVGLCQTGTRIGEAISSIQKLVQRIRLGLEPQISMTAALSKSWETNLGSFVLFQAYAKRVIYRENWIQWEELDAAGQSDAAKFLKQNLSVHGLSVPKPSPPFVSAGNSLLPKAQGFDSTQDLVLARLDASTNLEDEGISLMGTPNRSSQPTLLSSLATQANSHTPGSSDGPGNGGGGTDVPRIMSLLPVSGDQTSIPLWFQAAIRLGTSFIRIAAAGLPPAVWHSWDDNDATSSSMPCHCGKLHAPMVDEYYFWLEKGQYFDSADAINDGTLGVVPPDPTTDWERPEKLPQLLHWQKHSQVYLHWTRIHYGELSPPRRSTDSVPFDDSGDTLSLAFNGRQFDSLLFNLFGGATKGFRYDIATDSAVATPQVVPDTFPSTNGPAGLGAYPSFAYFSPGSPIFPVSTFGSALAIAGSLRSQCKFDEALAWCKSVFDPVQRENTWAQCRREEFVRTSMERFASQNVNEAAENPRGGVSVDQSCCPTSPVQVGIARGRATALEYIRILLQWGTKLHCLNTIESCKQALVVFDEAARLLGPKPSSINAKVTDAGVVTTISAFVPASAPLNPMLLELYEQVYDRRDLISRCLGAQRLKQRPDPLNAKCSNESIHEIDSCSCGIGQGPCCLPYKFTFLLAKSYELTSTVKGLGQNLLSALEKGDSEYLGSLRQSQERQLNELSLSNKQNSFRESDWQVQALDQQLQGAQTRLRYNQQLLQNGLNEGENAYLSGTTVAMQSRTAGNISEGIGQGMSFIPDFTMGGAGFGGSPVAITKLPLGSKLAQVFQAAARIMNVIGDISNTNASIGSTTGGWTRRSDDWQHQVDVISIELQQIKRQQLAAERRRDMALRDLNNHQLQIENSAETDAFLADKFSKHDLYLFLQQETASLYRRTFDLAWQTVQEAKESLKRERRDLVRQVNASLPADIGPAGWDSLREGLMAGEKLDTGLRTLERMYLRETGCREYELGKFVSLRLSFPLAFLQLKMLGWCEFEIPEWMFDLDYPGHYLRRIKNVSVTIPCIVGPYVNVNCRMQLLGSSTRLEPTLPIVPKCCCKSSRKCIGPLDRPDPCSSSTWPMHCSKPMAPETCISAYEHNDSLSRDFLATEAIATSSGQNDGGVFELSFRDDKMRAPFEFAGAAASRWRVELPPRNNSFDLASLTDFVLHINYTAKEGGASLREVAERAAWRRLPGDGVRFIDVRSESPSTWYSAFEKSHHEKERPRNKGSCGDEQRHHGKRKKHCRRLPLQLSRRSFPFLTGRRDVIVTSVHVFIDAAQPCKLGTHFPVEFVPRHGCPDDNKMFDCVSSDHTPGFFHGVLKDVHLGPLTGDQVEDLATLEFPEGLGDACVRDVYFLCYYEAVERECC